jgi:hypothetical protein
VSEIRWEPGLEDDDEERPALPREVPLEQELTSITPKAMSALHSELLENPYFIPLTARNRWRSKEDEADHDALAIRASQEAEYRVTTLLAVCHREKWRRQRTSPCYEAIVNTPLLYIARSTLSFICAGLNLKEAAAAAVTHIEAEDYGRIETSLGGSYEDGVEKFRRSRQAHKNHLKQVARMPKWDWQYDEQGNKRPVPFEDGLKALFPLPGCKGKRAQAERRKRFSAFLLDAIRDEHPDWKEEQLSAEAETRLEAMRHDDIPPVLFRAAILWVNELHRRRVSAMRSKASRASWAARGK